MYAFMDWMKAFDMKFLGEYLTVLRGFCQILYVLHFVKWVLNECYIANVFSLGQFSQLEQP